MRTITHVFDTSALLAHFFDQPGADVVAGIRASGSSLPGISAITVNRYLDQLTVCLPVDRAVAECAWQLRTATSRRLPLVDAIIAATARSIGAVLVHRDPHFRAIPDGLLERIEIPA